MKPAILHDVLFAPFFAGAAGPGHCWHWDRYVDGNGLWWQFGRFAEAVRGVDPAAEGFRPRAVEHPRLRVYVLEGKKLSLVWCRDAGNTWMSELRDGVPPAPLQGLMLELPGTRETGQVRSYDPWCDRWEDVPAAEGRIRLPVFTRSLVLRVLHSR